MAQSLAQVSHEFKALSMRLGSDELLVQGAGGNSSIKEGDCMWIKASGTRLETALESNIFTPVRHKMVVYNIENHPSQLLKDAVIGDNRLRPSIETTLHSLMPHKVVLHTHPVDIIALAVQEKGEHFFKKLLSGFKWVWVNYAKPGINLSIEVSNAIEGQVVDVLILGNHGLVVGGDDCQSAEILTQKIVTACKQSAREMVLTVRGVDSPIAGYRWENDPNISTLGSDLVSFEMCKKGVLYPDQAVFLGPNLPCVDRIDQLDRCVSSYKTRLQHEPSYIIVRGAGVLISETAKNTVCEMLNCHAHVLRRIKENTKLNALSVDKVADLLNWDAEKYRQSLV